MPVGHKVKDKDIFDVIEQCKTRIEAHFEISVTNKQKFFGYKNNVINIGKPDHNIVQLVQLIKNIASFLAVFSKIEATSLSGHLCELSAC